MSAQLHPPVLLVSAEEIERLLERQREYAPPPDYQMVARMAQSLYYLEETIAQQKLTMAKLSQLIFGERSERLHKIFPQGAGQEDGASGTGAGSEQSTTPESPSKAKSEKPKGHGRNGASEYSGAERIAVPHPELHSRCACPQCQKGKVYRLGEAGQILRIVGGPLLHARLYEPERWRCNLCGEIFTAPLPPEAGEKKYDETAGSMIALAKYGSGIPFHRLERMRASLQVPLPAATQWQIVAEVARQVKPVWEIVVVWDRLQAHRGQRLRLWLRRCRRLRLEYLPGYAPELKPNEYGWAYLKCNPLANYCPQHVEQLHTRVSLAGRQAATQQTLFRSFVHATGLPIRLSL